MTNEDYKALLPNLPTEPGVYQYMNDDLEILYVGKAKNLKNRISSYFTNKKNQTNKTRYLIAAATHLTFTIVDNEQEAFLLENTLIKRYQPRYNVQLKDGKSYPFICITNERFPRVIFTRKTYKGGGTYFGPYTSKYKTNVILELINTLFKLRTCTLALSEKNIQAEKFKVCLEYHIKNCDGPCQAFESEAVYNLKIEQIKHMLRGNFGAVKKYIYDQIQLASDAQAYEKAHELKLQLDAFDDYQSKSTVVNPSVSNVDVFSLDEDEKRAYVNFLRIVNGAVVYAYDIQLEKNLDDEKEDLLIFAIYEMMDKFNGLSDELIVPFEIPMIQEGINITVPVRGDKKKLLELSEKNALHFKLQKLKESTTRLKKETTTERLLRTIQEDLNLPRLPIHIECFDNSNIQGSYPVSSMVVFKNAKPSNAEYRHYNVKTVEGPNDFASMEEVVFRRYKRLLNEGKSLPQLIVIDGGKGQLSSAMKSLEVLGIDQQVTVIGIAKRLEEIFYPYDSVPLLINKKSESLKVIQQIRNEAHRFAITFHRDQRSKNFTSTQLTEIPGIGSQTAEKLLQHFKSVERIKNAMPSDLEALVGKSITKKILHFFDNNITLD